MNTSRSPKGVMTAKLFTPAEANRTLPLVRSIVADILEKARELRGRTALSKEPDEDEALEQIRQDILDLMQELEDLGATYKDWDFEVGLVDFPAKIDGREVLLCWRSDEPHVEWYHAREAGFAGRRRIPGHSFDEHDEI
ncbi:MAG: DUF2203 domain-containing protein [bacterium]